MARARRPPVYSPFAYARRAGLYKGLLGGDRRWLVVGGAAWGFRFLKKSFGKVEQVVALEKLEPGQSMLLQAIPPVTRRQRKADRKSARSGPAR